MSDGRVLAGCSRRRPSRKDDADGELYYRNTAEYVIPQVVDEGK